MTDTRIVDDVTVTEKTETEARAFVARWKGGAKPSKTTTCEASVTRSL